MQLNPKWYSLALLFCGISFIGLIVANLTEQGLWVIAPMTVAGLCLFRSIESKSKPTEPHYRTDYREDELLLDRVDANGSSPTVPYDREARPYKYIYDIDPTGNVIMLTFKWDKETYKYVQLDEGGEHEGVSESNT